MTSRCCLTARQGPGSRGALGKAAACLPVLLFLLVLLFLPTVPSPVAADDEPAPPPPAQPEPVPQPDPQPAPQPGEESEPAPPPAPLGETIEAVQSVVSKGDEAALAQALNTLDARTAEADDSVAFWVLYARIWVAQKKDLGELWRGIVAERQRAAPSSATFDLARARVETDPKLRRAAILSAFKRDPKHIEARIERAHLFLEDDEEDEADELLEGVLEDDPHALGALLALGRLYLSDGLPADALEYCDTALEKHQSAEVHSLRADCYRRMALNKPDAIRDALSASAEAMGLSPTEERIAVFKELLEETGDAATAASALRVHFARTKHPMLGGLLADLAFKAGDYPGALMGLGVGDATELATAKALAICHARLGNVEPARRACEQVLAVDSQGRLFAAEVALFLGDAEATLKHLGKLADGRALRLRALAHAWRAEPEAILAIAGKQMATGSRGGEALLVAWLQARMLKHVGPELADALRKKLLQARFEQGKNALEQGVDHSVDLGEAKTAGWPALALTWFRAPCGAFYERKGEGFGQSWSFDGGEVPSIASSVTGEASSGGETFSCEFTFNKVDAKSSGRFVRILEAQEKLGDFAPAEKAFAAACRAIVKGDRPAAEKAFATALGVEPNWSRLKVLQAILRALAPGAEKRDEARTATGAVKPWTDDFELRRVVIFLRAHAGDAELQEEIDALARREAQYNTRNLSAL